MRIEQLSQYIVPIILAGIWALTWMLNRDAQPLPPRPGRRDPSDRSGSTPSDAEAMARDFQEARGPSAPPQPRPPQPAPGQVRTMPTSLERPSGGNRQPTLKPGDAIVFTEVRSTRPGESTTRTADPRGQARTPASRRSSRAKANVAPPARGREAPAKPRELTQEIANSMAQLKGRQLELTPLNLPLSPLTSLPLTMSGFSSMSAAAPTPQFSRSAPGLIDVHKTLADPTRLREIFVWNELLQPPVSMRQGHLRRP